MLRHFSCGDSRNKGCVHAIPIFEYQMGNLLLKGLTALFLDLGEKQSFWDMTSGLHESSSNATR